MKRYEVLTDGENVWTISNDEGEMVRQVFSTWEEAESELNQHMIDMDEDGIDYEPADYRIVEIDIPDGEPDESHVP